MDKKVMTVGELIAELKKFPSYSEIHVARDPECNEIRTVDEVSTIEVPRQNGHREGEDNMRDIVVIFPTDTIIEQEV